MVLSLELVFGTICRAHVCRQKCGQG